MKRQKKLPSFACQTRLRVSYDSCRISDHIIFSPAEDGDDSANKQELIGLGCNQE